MRESDGIKLESTILALSMVGDLSMGQPTDQSNRTARLVQLLAQACHGAGEHTEVARQVALLRWSGCTANAEGFTRLLGDDVKGRHAMLSQTLGAAGLRAMRKSTPLAQVHCEVSGDIARTLGLSAPVEHGLRHVFEQFDGEGRPFGLRHPEVPEVVYQVLLAGDLEILSRVHGLEAALEWIAIKGNRRYPASLAALLTQHAEDWLESLRVPEVAPAKPCDDGAKVPLTLVGDVIDLKLPWLAGYSRRSAELVREAARLWGLPEQSVGQTGQAALIHGIGRAAVPNRIWNTTGVLLDGDLEQIRLVPYWTSRTCAQIPELAVPGRLAANAYERLDGSGYFRGLDGDALPSEQRLLAATLTWQALRCERPWRPAFNDSDAERLLLDEADQGRFDRRACQAVIAAARGESAVAPKANDSPLSDRETQILQRISMGGSNKEVARQLGISPSTVRTHVESVFRKLHCTTRAAATLKALTLGLI
ncbi:LuxR C-terminal-related transcriptional regulator [Pseudomonas azerbaijanoccidens]|uniref:HD domain-containing phosphohydrolase n=1 Tax=Pseudomonas azerbaijanoccidentalis TaxID=2842347 RepID=UPI00200AE6E7|nr:HD domain-containing phosphohydrolase [Pseudomonas azerbaijanoccidentalis]MCK8663739.1 LuxR C-terminal-related transcriptional regulator [Pseudomonas azerbaijanoccidentalis]